MSTELRSLAAAMLAHQVVGPRPLDTPDNYQRARFMVAGVLFGLYYRGSSYVFSWFAKQGTSPLTSQPTTALVTAGPYALSRNPALLLVWIFHTAVAVAFNSWWPLLVALPLTYAYLMLITVPNEEEELEKLFGRQFREYKQQTPRYLIPHSCAPDSTLQLAHLLPLPRVQCTTSASVSTADYPGSLRSSWRLARVCRRVCGDDACGRGDSKSSPVDEDVGNSNDSEAEATRPAAAAAPAAKQKSVRRRTPKETDRLRQMFSERGYEPTLCSLGSQPTATVYPGD